MYFSFVITLYLRAKSQRFMSNGTDSSQKFIVYNGAVDVLFGPQFYDLIKEEWR